MNINKFYKKILKELNIQSFELNKRTGVKTKSLPGITYQTDLQIDGFPLLSMRKIPLSFIPEQIWFLSGSNNIKWLSKHTKIWNSFAQKNGRVTSAYGHRWRKHFKIDQLQIVIDKLKKDSSDRHGVIMMWSPKEDLTIKQKNVPCPYTMTINIINNRLHLHLIVRSNDMVLGFPTDVAGFALLQIILAKELGIEPGIYTHSISNAHFYENQQYVVNTLLLIKLYKYSNVNIKIPKDTLSRAKKLDDNLIKEIKLTNYKPRKPIKNIPIAL